MDVRELLVQVSHSVRCFYRNTVVEFAGVVFGILHEVDVSRKDYELLKHHCSGSLAHGDVIDHDWGSRGACPCLRSTKF